MLDTMPRFSEVRTEAGYVVSDIDGEFPSEYAGGFDSALTLADHRNGMHTQRAPMDCLACRESNSILPQISTNPSTLSA